MTPTTNGNDDNLSVYKDLVERIRSEEEEERKLAIMRIPNLILQSLEHKNEVILNQTLLVIYNLSTDSEPYENLTLGNRTHIFRHLLRLFTNSIKKPKHEQIDALIKLIDHADTSQFLIELSNSFYHCWDCEENELVVDALQTIKNKATANLYEDALLMVHSVFGLIDTRNC